MGNFVSKCFSTTKNEKKTKEDYVIYNNKKETVKSEKTNADLSNIAKVNSKTSENNLKESTDKKQAINSNLNQKEIVLM
jgi:hypothetical protein